MHPFRPTYLRLCARDESRALAAVALGCLTAFRTGEMPSVRLVTVSEVEIEIVAEIKKRSRRDRWETVKLGPASQTLDWDPFWVVHRYVTDRRRRKGQADPDQPFAGLRHGEVAAKVRDLVDQICAGLPEHIVRSIGLFPGSSRYGGHSLRHGAATALIEAGGSRDYVRRFGHWETLAMVDRYTREANHIFGDNLRDLSGSAVTDALLRLDDLGFGL